MTIRSVASVEMSSRLTLFIFFAVLLVDFTSAINCFDSHTGEIDDCGDDNWCGVTALDRGCWAGCKRKSRAPSCHWEHRCCCNTDGCNAPPQPAPPPGQSTTAAPTTTTKSTEAPTTTMNTTKVFTTAKLTVPEDSTSYAGHAGIWMEIASLIAIFTTRI